MIEPPALRVILPALESLVFGREHDVTEAQADNLELGIPSAVLISDSLAYELGKRVGTFRSSFDLCERHSGEHEVRYTYLGAYLPLLGGILERKECR